MILTPAYSRDYKSKKALLDDFNNDKDFIINDFNGPYDGKPVNKSGLKSGFNVSIQFRYSKNRKTFIHNFK